MDVAILRWPVEEAARTDLAERGIPRLLLVADNEPPPQPLDALEDWIRVPAPEADVSRRMDTLRQRVASSRDRPPEIDDDGVVRFGDEWTTLPPVESRLMRRLIEGYRSVVSRADLARAGWPKGDPGRNALDVHVLRLRRRIESMGLAISTVRSRGYLLDATRRAPANGNGSGPPAEA